MKDVAAAANVSLATVSRVVNGRLEVRDDLRTRVEEAIGRLGYRRDLTASTLRRADRVSASLGLIYEDLSNPFFAAVHRGVEEVARARGVLTLAGSSDEDPGLERDLAGALASRGVDGLIVVPCGHDQAYLQPERAMGMAIVFVDRPPAGLDADMVASDNAGGARAAVEHLIEHGHRRIGFLGDRPHIATAIHRRRGYRAALAAAGIEPDPALERTDCVDEATSARAAYDLLDAAEPPTALFTAQNLVTIGGVRVLRSRGVQYEVAHVGFDDIALADVLDPGITVVRQDPLALGRRAAELLFARLDGDDGPPREVVLETELVERGSGEIAPPER